MSRNLRPAATPPRLPLALAGLLLATGASAAAQDRPASIGSAPAAFVQESWTVADGLPVNAVNVVIQSRDGYVWAATYDGLVRFDGVRFTVYNTSNNKGLPSNRIVDMLEARDGSLWLRTEQFHVVRFRDGAFTHFGPAHGLRDGAFEIYEDSGGVIWVGTDGALGVIRDERYVPVAASVIDAQVVRIRQTRDGTVWVGTSGSGLFRLDGQDARAVQLGGRAGDETIRALYEDPRGALWIGTQSGAYRYQGGRLEPVEPAQLPREPVLDFIASPDARTVWLIGQQSIHRLEDRRLTRLDARYRDIHQRGQLGFDDDGRLWYTSGAVLFRDEQPVFRFGGGSDEDPLPAGTITSFAQDHEGSLWVGTHAAGLHRLKPAMFTVYGEPEGVGYRNIYPVLEDRTGAIWLGTWGMGLSRIADGRITNYTPSMGAPPLVRSLLHDRAGRLWVGSRGESLFWCELPALACARQDALPATATVSALYEDPRGAVWVGSDAGLFRWAEGRWSRFDPADGAPASVVRAFIETADGALWMGTNGGGLARFRDGRFTLVNSEDGLPSDLIRALYQDPYGFLWVGTEGRGLAWVDPRGPPYRIANVGTRQGLFDDVIHQILADDYGRLWMSTNRGIFHVRLQELAAVADGTAPHVRSTAYTERDGLRNREANGGIQPAGIRARDGRLWFPTQNGVAVVDPSRLQQNRAPPPVVIERVTAGDSAYLATDAPLRLRVGKRDLEIAYTGLSLLAPENVRFRYRLEGYDADWIEAGARRTAFYTRVPPGRYTFRVLASNNEGVWTEEGAALALVVPPRLYETAGFRGLGLLLLALLPLAAFRWRGQLARARERELRGLVDARTADVVERERRLEAQNAQLEAQAAELSRLDQARSRFFANVSHEFRTPLTLTIGPLEDARTRAGDALGGALARQLDMALRNARRLLRLVNQIMDVARLESGHMTLRLERADLVTFVRGIAAAFTPVAEQKRIGFEVRAEPERIPIAFDADALEKVFTNLLSNAFKFTQEGGSVELTLSAGHGADQVTARVADTGPGIPPADLPHVFERFWQPDAVPARLQPGTGIGLSLARELVELHGGTIGVESGPAGGAVFTVELPLGEEAGHAGIAPEEDEDADDEEQRDVPRLLVIDDNEDMRAYVRAHFEGRYRVVEAADGTQGIAAARALLPDLVISDVMMPGTDGHALGRALRASRETDFIPLILLTARGSSEHRIAGLESGADDYVVKPFEMRELDARVSNLIASRRRLRERSGDPTTVLPAPTVDHLSPADAALLERVRRAIEARLGDGDFGVAELAREVYLDRSHLYRRIRTLLGESPSDLIRRLRLEHAAGLLAGGSGSVAEVAYASGFNSVSYFCQSFREAYGVTPAAWREQPVGR